MTGTSIDTCFRPADSMRSRFSASRTSAAIARNASPSESPRSCAAITASTKRSNGGNPSPRARCRSASASGTPPRATRSATRISDGQRPAARTGDQLERATEALAGCDRKAHHVDRGRELRRGRGPRRVAIASVSARSRPTTPTAAKATATRSADSGVITRPRAARPTISSRPPANPPTPQAACSARKPDGVSGEPATDSRAGEVATVVAEQPLHAGAEVLEHRVERARNAGAAGSVDREETRTAWAERSEVRDESLGERRPAESWQAPDEERQTQEAGARRRTSPGARSHRLRDGARRDRRPEHPRLLGQPTDREHQPVSDDRGDRATDQDDEAGERVVRRALPGAGSPRAAARATVPPRPTRAATSVHDWRACTSLRMVRSSRRNVPSVRSTWPSSRPPTRWAMTSVATTRSAVGSASAIPSRSSAPTKSPEMRWSATSAAERGPERDRSALRDESDCGRQRVTGPDRPGQQLDRFGPALLARPPGRAPTRPVVRDRCVRAGDEAEQRDRRRADDARTRSSHRQFRSRRSVPTNCPGDTDPSPPASSQASSRSAVRRVSPRRTGRGGDVHAS